MNAGIKTLGLVTLTAGLIAGCSSDDDGDGDMNTGGNGTGTQTTDIELDISGLEPLGGGYEYEGWIVVDDAPVSTGRFNIVEGTSSYVMSAPSDQVAAAAMFVLSIEPPNDADPGPSAVKVLGGAFESGVASLSVGHMAALGTDFASAAGSYILETPSSSDMADYFQGIWFLDMGAGPGPSLTLPELPEGWVYEGWVAGPDGPVSTGTFSTPSGEDSDGAGDTAGPEMTPPFPGQDFITPPTDLASGDFAAVISVEPVPDDSPAPFAIKPLVDMTIDDVAPPMAQDLTPMLDGLPAGTATIL